MTRDVFISHAGDDASVAVEVCALLERRGLKCWMAPRDVAAGSVWDEAILDAIESSRVFLLILSRSANQSQFVKNEVNRAFSQSKPIVTFRLEDVPPGRSLELYLARHHWTDAFPPPMGARVESLAGSITALLDSASAASGVSAAPVAAPAPPTLLSRMMSPVFAAGERVRHLSRESLVFGLIALLVGSALTFGFLWNRKSSAPPQPVGRYVITVPSTQELTVLNGSGSHLLAISPDGKYIAYTAIQNGVEGLFMRSSDNLEPRLVSSPDEAGAGEPFFSPDGHWLGYVSSEGKLKKVSVDGGQPTVICDVEPRFEDGVTWGSRGNIIFGRYADGLWQVPESGGTPKQLTSPASGPLNQFWPTFLPGSNAVLFTADNGTSPQIAVLSLDTGKVRNLIGGTDPSYSPSGHLLFTQAGTLMAVPFDLQRLEITGNPVPVVDGLLVHGSSNSISSSTDYSLSSNGTLVYVPGSSRNAPVHLEWVTRDGAELPLPAAPHVYVLPKISPDGKRIAIGITEKDAQLYIYDIARDTLNRFTFQGSNNLVPLWTPDGKRIAYISNSTGPRNIFWQLADGSGGFERLNTSPQLSIPGSWSPDGKVLAYSIIDPHMGYDIWTLTPSDHKTQIFLQTKSNESAPQFSPDGRWLAYTSDESGHYEIYVVPYPGLGGKWQISSDGGREPLWNRNGRELFFRNGNKMMAAPINTQQGFSAGTPKMLFQGQYVTLSNSTPNYDVTADGQKFLMLKTTVPPTQINVIVNWFEELKQKVPTGKK
jgi:Tol biopolymer transport system component